MGALKKGPVKMDASKKWACQNGHVKNHQWFQPDELNVNGFQKVGLVDGLKFPIIFVFRSKESYL